eukprot:6236576-Prymnesium_polylepis.1
MRELADLSSVLSLVEAHEAAREAARGGTRPNETAAAGDGRRYEWLVYSRLEFRWWTDHPPLALLDRAR